MYRLECFFMVEFFFHYMFGLFIKFNNCLFSTGTQTTIKLDDGIPVTHFYVFKYQFGNGTLKLQTNWVIVSVTDFSRLQITVLKQKTNRFF